MEGIINEYGILLIKRGTIIRKQICPYSRASQLESSCKDDCPLFGEPQSTASGTMIMLNLYKKTLMFNKLVDERK